MSGFLRLGSALLPTHRLILVPDGQSRLADSQLYLLGRLASRGRVDFALQEGRTVPLIHHNRLPHSLPRLSLDGTGVPLQSTYLIKQLMRYVLGLGCDEEIGEIVWSGIAFVMFEEGIIQQCL